MRPGLGPGGHQGLEGSSHLRGYRASMRPGLGPGGHGTAGIEHIAKDDVASMRPGLGPGGHGRSTQMRLRDSCCFNEAGAGPRWSPVRIRIHVRGTLSFNEAGAGPRWSPSRPMSSVTPESSCFNEAGAGPRWSHGRLHRRHLLSSAASMRPGLGPGGHGLLPRASSIERKTGKREGCAPQPLWTCRPMNHLRFHDIKKPCLPIRIAHSRADVEIFSPSRRPPARRRIRDRAAPSHALR